jgi:hypothetical protein
MNIYCNENKLDSNFFIRDDIICFLSLSKNITSSCYNDIICNYQTIIFGKNCLFGDEFFQSLIDILPNSIKNIIFEDESTYNKPIDNFPLGLKKIKFGNYFSQPLDNLPSSLEELEFAKYSQFNCAIDNLPNCLKKIKFGKYFNIPINNLPPNL